MSNTSITDQTVSDAYHEPLAHYVPSKIKTFLINYGFLRARVIFRKLWWPLERALFKTFRRSKKLCIIRQRKSTTGLFACFIRILSGISYADRRAMIPVADMQTCQNVYHYDEEVGSVNTWEYYYEQPAGISVNEALSAENFTVIDTVLCPNPRQYAPFYYDHDGQLTYWRRLCKKYIRFKQPVLDRLELEAQKFIGKRVLGVSVRGTDYISLKPHAHPVQPTTEQALSKTRDVMSTGDYDAVYLATEDKNILAAFQKVFGDKLLLSENDYLDFDYSADRYVTTYFTDRNNDKYLRGLEYIVSKLLLTKCQGLITSITSGSCGVMCLSEGYDYLYVFDLGIYD